MISGSNLKFGDGDELIYDYDDIEIEEDDDDEEDKLEENNEKR